MRDDSTIEEVLSYMRRLKRRFPGIKVYFENCAEEKGGTYLKFRPEFITTLDLDDNLNIASVNVPIG